MSKYSDADIQKLYMRLLKRTPHASERDYWHANATTLVELRKGIIGSTEYRARVEPMKERTLAAFLGVVAAGTYLVLGWLLALMLGAKSGLVLFACVAVGPIALSAVLLMLCLPFAELYLLLAERRPTAATRRAKGEDPAQQETPAGRAAEVSS